MTQHRRRRWVPTNLAGTGRYMSVLRIHPTGEECLGFWAALPVLFLNTQRRCSGGGGQEVGEARGSGTARRFLPRRHFGGVQVQASRGSWRNVLR